MRPILLWLALFTRRYFVLISAVLALLGLTIAWHAAVPGENPVHWITVTMPPEPARCPPPPARECPAPEPRVVIEPFDAGRLDDDMPYRGQLLRGVRWSDRRGDNTVLFSQIVSKAETGESRYLFLRHYVIDPSGDVHFVQGIRQHDENCFDGDLTTSFHRAAKVTDLDQDGVGELTFALFHGACVTDMSAAEFKLFAIEDGDKHVLRGTAYYGGMDTPTQPRDRSGVAKAPPEIARHLEILWPWLANQLMGELPI